MKRIFLLFILIIFTQIAFANNITKSHLSTGENIQPGCVLIDNDTCIFDSLKKTYSHTPIVSKCDEFKHILEKTLLKICEVRRNTELWETLLSRINISHN